MFVGDMIMRSGCYLEGKKSVEAPEPACGGQKYNWDGVVGESPY